MHQLLKVFLPFMSYFLQVFFRSSTPDTVSTDFPSPVTTRVLRMVMLNWTRDELCVDVEAFGCLAEPCEWEVGEPCEWEVGVWLNHVSGRWYVSG